MSSVTTNYNFLKPAVGELYDVTIYDSTLDKIDAAITDPGVVSKAPRGLVAEVETPSAGAAATGTQIEQNIATFTFKANRWYEIEWITSIQCSAAQTSALAQIWSCSTADAANLTTGLTELRGYNLISTGSHNVVANPKRKIKYAVDTTLQIKASINGNGVSLTRQAGPTYPSQLSITDLGMQF